MPVESQLSHRNVKHANLPYVSNLSPTATDPCYIPGSQDILTSIAGYAERRFGFADSDATGFNNLQRVFAWDRNDGSFFKMYCDINGSNQAVVSKFAVGIDSVPSVIYTDTGSSTAFDFVVSNNTVYFSNGHVAKKWDPVNGVSNWGIGIGSVSNAVGPNGVGTGTDVAATSGTAWANPGNITANDGAFATVTIVPGTGTNTPATFPAGASSLGAPVWNNPGNIRVDDGVSATCLVTAFNTSAQLLASNFGFAIPLTATITGVLVEIKRAQTAGAGSLIDQLVRLTKAGVAGGTNHAAGAWPGALTYQSYGGSTDLWGLTLAPADINNSGFGVQLTADETGGASATAAVDAIRVTIYYKQVGGSGVSDLLQGTNCGFALTSSQTVTGVLVEVEGLQTQIANATLQATLIKSGNTAGTTKLGMQLPSSNSFISYGGTGDLWGTTLTYNDVNQANFGVSLQAVNASGSSVTYSVDFVRITIFGLGGPTVTTTGSGGFSAYFGYAYVFCYGNSNTGHVSSPSPASVSTGPFGGVISSTTIAAGGSGYAANDTGTISAGNFNATYTVNTVTGGSVTTYTISAAGTGFPIVNNVSTAVGGTQPGTGKGFALNITAVTGVNHAVVSLTASTDPQVNQIRVFRSTDSVPIGTAAAVYFELPTSPYPNTTANINDSVADNGLNQYSIAPLPGFNDPPTPFRGATYFAGRIWGFLNNKDYFSGLEEITTGVPEESFVSGVAGNFWNFDQPVQGLAVAGSANAQTLLTFCGGRLYGIVGNSLDTFRKFLISNRRGCRNLTAISTLGAMVAWFDSAGQVWGTDGTGMQELGIDIRPDLAGIPAANVSLTFHASGKAHWLVVSTGNKLLVQDMDTEQWMPPWSFASTYVYSGEIAAGTYKLFGCQAATSLTLSATAHNDNGSSYQPIGQTNLFAVVPDFGTRFSSVSVGLYDEPTRTGLPWLFQVDTNQFPLTDVSFVADDDPLNPLTTYTSIFANATTPQVAFNRNQGTYLVQNPFPLTQPVARWIGWQWKGAIQDDGLRIYGFCMGYTQKR